MPVVKVVAIALASTTAAILAAEPKTPRGASCLSDGSEAGFFMLPVTNDARTLASISAWGWAFVTQLFVQSHVTTFTVGFVFPFFFLPDRSGRTGYATAPRFPAEASVGTGCNLDIFRHLLIIDTLAMEGTLYATRIVDCFITIGAIPSPPRTREPAGICNPELTTIRRRHSPSVSMPRLRPDRAQVFLFLLAFLICGDQFRRDVRHGGARLRIR
jgi:hypothetical protein